MTFQHLGALLNEAVELAHAFGVMVFQRDQCIGKDGQSDG